MDENEFIDFERFFTHKLDEYKDACEERGYTFLECLYDIIDKISNED